MNFNDFFGSIHLEVFRELNPLVYKFPPSGSGLLVGYWNFSDNISLEFDYNLSNSQVQDLYLMVVI